MFTNFDAIVHSLTFMTVMVVGYDYDRSNGMVYKAGGQSAYSSDDDV